MSIEELREAIASVEAIAPRLGIWPDEIAYYAPKVAERARVLMDGSDVSTSEGLLLSALLWDLKEQLKDRECNLSRAAGGKCIC